MDPELNQKAFEEQIELLINYKKFNPNKEVTLSERSLKRALKWYQTFASGDGVGSSLMDSVSAQDVGE